jgi:hypothetical protein
MDTDITLSEAMTVQQRMKKRIQMRILAPKMKMAKKRNAMRMAPKEKLEARAKKKAKNVLIQKIAKKPKSEMSFAERGRVEDKLAKMKSKVDMMAKKLFKDVKKQEVQRLRGMKNPEK